jgi:sarcosine oxidase
MTTIDQRWDAIVVGGGAMGTSAAWHLARRGRRTLLLERFAIGHDRGSSHGATRIFRLSYHHPDYVRMARLALDHWRELEDAAGEELLIGTGGLDAGAGSAAAADALASAGEAHEWLASEDVEERWPGLIARPEPRLLFQPDAGVCLAARAVRAQARVAASAGAVIREDDPAEVVIPGMDRVEVRTRRGPAEAPVAVVAAGAWAGPLLQRAGLPLPLSVTRQQVSYFAEGTGAPLPTVIEWTEPPDPAPYLVPDPTAPGTVKVAEHMAGPPVTADTRTFDVDPTLQARCAAVARRWLRHLGPELEVETCLYTSTPDEDFVIDRVGPVVVATGFSGHGFKFAPLVGRALADLALGEEPPVPRARFSVSRFAGARPAGAQGRTG